MALSATRCLSLKLEKACILCCVSLLDKLLVVGSTGLVGSKIASLAHGYEFETYNTHNSRPSPFPNSTKLDITDRDATMTLLAKIRPYAIINVAALTNVDYCETHKEEAERVNVGGATSLADAARQNNSRFVHVSTDSVFDGTYGHYTEDDMPNPINHYSKTKLDPETVVAQLLSYAIARPSVVYGWHARVGRTPSGSTKAMNFAMFVLDRLGKSEPVRVVRDQYSSPTFADNLAHSLLRLARLTENGIFHTAGRSCLSRYEFALLLAKIFGYPPDLVQPVSTGEFDQAAQRPKNCCLRVEKAEKALKMHFLTAQEGLIEMKKQARSKPNDR